jgi:hypothetical protein
MLRQPKFSVIFVTAYLVLYAIFLTGGNERLILIARYQLLFSPLLLVWMTFTVIRYGKFSGRELKEGEEYGYDDYHPVE